MDLKIFIFNLDLQLIFCFLLILILLCFFCLVHKQNKTKQSENVKNLNGPLDFSLRLSGYDSFCVFFCCGFNHFFQLIFVRLYISLIVQSNVYTSMGEFPSCLLFPWLFALFFYLFVLTESLARSLTNINRA